MIKYIPLRSKRLRISFFLTKSAIYTTLCSLLLALIFAFLSIGLGEIKISLSEMVDVFLGKGTEEHTFVIETLRLPRITVSLLVGIAFAVSGGILQGIMRNPLASPDIVGIMAGASVASVAFITFLMEKVSIHWLPLAAISGAGLISILMYIFSWKQGVTPIRLVLVGIGVTELTKAITKMLLTMNPSHTASQAYIWLTGSVYGSSWYHVFMLSPWILVFVPLAFIFARKLNVQELGDEIATSLGSSVQRQRIHLLLISVALAGSAVAIGGGISFVGLLAPHIARKLVGPSFGGLLPAAAMIGGIIVLLADLLARTAFEPLDVPVGVFTSAIGAPFFIYLLFRNRNH